MKPNAHLLFRLSRRLLLAAVGVALASLRLQAAGPWTALFNGTNLAGWRPPVGDWAAAQAVSLDPRDAKQLVVRVGQGVLDNGAAGKTVNLITEAEWGDVEAHIEFCIPERSNSGIYFMGRYELQVYDSYGVAKDQYPGIECGGIYPRWTPDRHEFEGHSPRVNASKPPGTWQTFDVVFRGPRFDAGGRKVANAKFVSVRHNGVVIHENIEVTGPTRSARWADEKPCGPLLLQGDHGPVAYRNLRIRAIELK